MKLVLFDIDKTLLDGSYVKDYVAFPDAIKLIFGVDADIDSVAHPGMTDKQIVLEVLKKKGLTEEKINEKMEEYFAALSELFHRNIDKDEIKILDGVKELLEQLKKNNILMGLVTGNAEHIAKERIQRANLEQFFHIGGFGSEDFRRANLVRNAIKRAETKLGFIFNDNVFLIGDTPNDMKAGKEAGVKTIGVATGRHSRKQLKDAGADFTVENLKSKSISNILKINNSQQ